MKNALLEEEAAKRIVASALSRKFHPRRVLLPLPSFSEVEDISGGTKRRNETMERTREARSQVAHDLQYFNPGRDQASVVFVVVRHNMASKSEHGRV